MIRPVSAESLFQALQQASRIVSQVSNILFEGCFWRGNCQILSTGLSYGEWGGRNIREMFSSMTRSPDLCQPAPPTSMTAWAPKLTFPLVSSRCFLHGHGAGIRHDERRPHIARRTDSAENIAGGMALVRRLPGTRAFSCPLIALLVSSRISAMASRRRACLASLLLRDCPLSWSLVLSSLKAMAAGIISSRIRVWSQ